MSIICDISYNSNRGRFYEKGICTMVRGFDPRLVTNSATIASLTSTTLSDYTALQLNGKTSITGIKFINGYSNESKYQFNTFSIYVKVYLTDSNRIFQWNYTGSDTNWYRNFGCINYDSSTNKLGLTISGTTDFIEAQVNDLTNAWHEFILTYDEGVVNLYLDGDLQITHTFENPSTQSPVSAQSYIFLDSDGYLNRFRAVDYIMNVSNPIVEPPISEYVIMDYPFTNNIGTNQSTSSRAVDFTQFTSASYDSEEDAYYIECWGWKYVNGVDSYYFDLTGSWTIEFDIKVTSFSGSGFKDILQLKDSNNDGVVAVLGIDSDRVATLYNATSEYATQNLLNKWRHFEVKGSTTKIETYLDGVLVNTLNRNLYDNIAGLRLNACQDSRLFYYMKNFKFAIGIDSLIEPIRYYLLFSNIEIDS